MAQEFLCEAPETSPLDYLSSVLKQILQSLIPLVAAVPLFTMIVELRGKRPPSRKWPWFVFSFFFLIWHGILARYLDASDYWRSMIRIGDLALLLAFAALFISDERRRSSEPIEKPFLLRGLVGLLVFTIVEAVFSFAVEPAVFLVPLFAAILLAFVYDRLYSFRSYYPKPRMHLVFFFYILSQLLVLPSFRLLFLVQIAYVFVRRYWNWIDHKDREIFLYEESRRINQKIVTRMGETVNDFSDLHEALGSFLATLSDGIEAKSAAIYIWDEKNSLFRCSDIHGVFFPLVCGNEMSFTHVEALRKIAFSQNIAEKENIVWEVAMSRQGAFIPYASRDKRILALGSRAVNITSLILEPLFFDGQLLGVLVVENKQFERYFTDNDYYLVQNFAHYATMILKAHDALLERQNQARAVAELQLGFHIQSGLLPSRIPEFEGISLAGSMTPAKEIGGDYFDFLNLPNGNLGIVIGDVSGKGVPAGMVMTSLYAFLHAECRYFANTYRTLVHVNADLAGHISETMFASLLFFEWNPRAKSLHYTSCGHEHILHYRQAERRLETIRSGGIALGMVGDNSKIIREKSLIVRPGDTVLLYTDGVTESANEKKEMFGLERLGAFLEKFQALSAEEIRQELLDELRTFAHGSPQADDITVLVMKF